MTLKDISGFVASMGLWCNKSSYETIADWTDGKRDYFIVYNAYPFLEKDRCSDAVLLKVGTNGKGRIVSIDKEDWIDACDKRFREFYKKCLDEGVFDRYAVEREDC